MIEKYQIQCAWQYWSEIIFRAYVVAGTEICYQKMTREKCWNFITKSTMQMAEITQKKI